MPDAVNNGQYGIGIVIDFFGLSAKARASRSSSSTRRVTAIVPANVGIIANAKNPKARKRFVEFLLSEEGQQILLDPKISRLPVRPATYAKAPAGLSQSRSTARSRPKVNFDSDLSETRYELVNSLFDRIITFRLKELDAAWKAIHDAEAKLGGKRQRRRRQSCSPRRASSPRRADQRGGSQATRRSPALFQRRRPRRRPRQAEFEEKWEQPARKNYAEARRAREEARSLATCAET